ncbi:HtaA domain-containing protein [Humidisolicoccus flavus]|uniref:HtaA domain-containing protein n=1 Tax=Humidisolicoccus flavus TaxID=3111414 RepID=UPI0032546560
MDRTAPKIGRSAIAFALTLMLVLAGLIGVAFAPKASAAEQNVTSGTLDWGLRGSFVTYIQQPWAGGAITMSDGLQRTGNVFNWSGGTGTADTATPSALVGFPGTVHFTAHNGALDLTVSDVRVRIDSATAGTIVVDASSAAMDGSGIQTWNDIDMASFVIPEGAVSGDTITVANAPAVFTAVGAEPFGSSYNPGDPVEPVSFTLQLAPVVTPEPSTPAPSEPVETPGPSTPAPSEPVVTPEPSTPAPSEPVVTPEPSTPAPSNPAPSTPAVTPPPAPEASAPTTETGLATSNGSLSWNIKTSFRNYVGGPIARGAVTVNGVTANDASFDWAGGIGTADAASNTATVLFPGEVRFSGHSGALDFVISDVRLRIDSATQGTIVANIVSKEFTGMAPGAPQGEYAIFDSVEFATVSLDNVNIREGQISIANAPAVLTDAGAAAFGGFYEAGTDLDPINAAFTLALVENPTVPVVTPPVTPGTTPPAVENPAVDNGGNNGGVDNGGVAAPAGTPAATPIETCAAVSVSGATLNWGVRSSFRNYISGGIANGGWTTSGNITDVSGGWAWSGGTGSINTDTMTGTVRYAGTLQFTGHNGALDLKISNVRIKMNSASSGYLIADVVSKSMDGTTGTYNGINFASLSFSASSTGGSISVTGAGATLTAAGSQAFAGFYSAGEALDTLAFSFPLGGEVECSSAAGTLPKTGADMELALPIAGALLLLLGFGFARFRRAQEL